LEQEPRIHAPADASAMQMWAGVECTINRVGDDFHDQCRKNGHARRLSDLELFADLGITALRYPVLWELAAPERPDQLDWTWADERLPRLRELGVRPIVGLVHHGSGPRYTSLVDPAFPELLAAYARQVAERFPWVTDWTPVNEPLTTARFSGMYGLWYPHGTDEVTFGRCFLNQCRAVVLAMRAVRQVNPEARLIQTDDLGKTYSTPTLSYQAAFENERRWLTWDLLSGMVDASHPVWDYLRQCGASEAQLLWFRDNPCPPDVIGVNHYVTSERYLDEAVERYPAHTYGGNGYHRYADIEAVRVRVDGIGGARMALREAWERYGTTLAITEAHLGCSREEQMRWLGEVWNEAQSLRRFGVDVEAVTAWSLLGAYDWNSLLARSEGHYEPGVFDIRGGSPRPTALAGLVRDLATGRKTMHPVLSGQGWWRRPLRLTYETSDATVSRVATSDNDERADFRRRAAAPPLLITGATGTLGGAFARLCDLRGIPHRLLTRRELDIADLASVQAALDRFRPWAVVNAAGYVRVDEAQTDRDRCFRENAQGPALLAAECARQETALVTFSSDLVFGNDAKREAPYLESDRVSPRCVYGMSKAEAERRVLEVMPSALVIRTSAFFGPWDEYNFVTSALREMLAGRPFVAARDGMVSPTYLPDLVNATLDLLIDGVAGIVHLANRGAVTWAEFALMAAEKAGLDEQRVHALLRSVETRDLNLAAPRPTFSVLDSERVPVMPSLESALERYFLDTRHQLQTEDLRSDCPLLAA
jgi:dTDP-4-dehydrorhamnose reductase